MLAAERGAAQNTLEAYRRDLDAYAGFLAGRGGEVATAGPDDIRAFLGRLAQAGMAPRTAARRLSALRQFYRFLLSERSEEHTSELQSLMRISYAVFCLKKKKQQKKRLA